MDVINLLIAALLHDIGKLIERSKVYDNKKVNEIFTNIKYSHAKYTAFFLKSYFSKDIWIKTNKDNILELASNHHNPKSPNGRLLQFADWLASSEREKDEENTQQYNTVQLRSILGTLNNQNNKLFHQLDKLSFQNFIIHNKNEELTRKNYQSISEPMISEFHKIHDIEDLIFLLEKYLSFVPAQTTGNDPDISLFDHSKLTAAIAVCLYHQVENGRLTDENVKDYLKRMRNEKISDEHFILINADLSGIQNFIFNIPSKGAAKSLKGRSTYLVFLMEAISQYIIRNLNLSKTNIIYNGGGNFYILAPENSSDKIVKLKQDINRTIFKIHNGKLMCNIGYTKIKLYEFRDFKNVWQRVSRQTAKIKMKKFSDIWNESYNELFNAKNIIQDDEYCNVCHSTKNVQTYENTKLCSMCYSFETLTTKISNAKYFYLDHTIKSDKENTYNSTLASFNNFIEFSDTKPLVKDYYALNDFGNDQTLKWKLGTYNLPYKNNVDRKTFEEIAGKSGKLAYLKLDVDNLGKLFINGLKNPSLSRMSVLSRNFRMFFEGFLPYFIKLKQLENDIYVVFSGGDDTFLISNLEIILKFTEQLRNKFQEFVCNNKTITFSAGIGIFDDKFPIIKSAEITENLLIKAKELLYPGETEPGKNKIAILGEVFNWDEYGFILKLYEEIKELVSDSSTNSRAIIRKIISSTSGFKPILDSSQNGKLNTQKIWRLRYYLRNATNDVQDKLIKIYENMWIHNFFEKEENKIMNHQIITVAAKLADLQIRNKEE